MNERHVCPNCGRLIRYNTYLGCRVCPRCGFMERDGKKTLSCSEAYLTGVLPRKGEKV